MKRILVLALTLAMSISGSALFAAAPKIAQQGGSIAGTATSQSGDVLPNVTVQLRDLATGQIVQTKTTGQNGAYSFEGLAAGNYAVEAVNAAGQVIGTSASISLTAGQAITGTVLQANAGLLGAGGAAAQGASGGVGAGVSTAVIIAVAAGTAFIGAQTSGNSATNASPSR
ncbi:MAG TPA: carboxypeptidase-like regulatory domain-containing protein [Vicinamibacterales bacterium]|nr:carboxypeptidase-like regulatory domain-containing protein [Vicinamibacterales bacterium]